VRALIVDDEALARQRLASMLAAEPDIEVIGEANGGSAAVQAIADRRPDLVFLDVQMPGLDGFGVLRCTAGAHRPTVIFVTAHDEHAIRAFEVQAADYLLKPVVAARLKEAVRRAVERVHRAAPTDRPTAIDKVLAEAPATPPAAAKIPVRQATGFLLVPVAEILWIEADRDHLRLHTAATTHVVRETMADIEARLEPFKFLRVHRSAIINLAVLASVTPIVKGDYHLVLRNGTRLRSGRRYRRQIQALIR
jgi:two-component system LytT family response regulator